jgi:2-oxoglutarate dehydrogenase E2 component (dihydrolipoamide succinyltransferase)
VDLAAVDPTGPAGRVTRGDLERHATPLASVRSAAPDAGPGRAPAPAAAPGLAPGDRVIPMSPLRKLVAEHMQTSKRVSPHVGTVTEIDLSAVMRVRAERAAAFRESRGYGLSVLSFVVHASARALREHPALNASVVGDDIVEKGDVHLGIAVETEKGLIVPVIRHADRLSLTGIAETIHDLAERARTRRISPDELRGGTFTLSNPGREGNLYGFAIIHQPQVGILRMGEIAKRAVVRTLDGEDVIAIRPTMHLALSYDHRAVDGAPANAFLARIRALLEQGDFAS